MAFCTLAALLATALPAERAVHSDAATDPHPSRLAARRMGLELLVPRNAPATNPQLYLRSSFRGAPPCIAPQSATLSDATPPEFTACEPCADAPAVTEWPWWPGERPRAWVAPRPAGAGAEAPAGVAWGDLWQPRAVPGATGGWERHLAPAPAEAETPRPLPRPYLGGDEIVAGDPPAGGSERVA